MAKNTGSGEDRAKVKFRFYEFELEGGSTSVENSIKQITQAFGARPAAVVTPKQAQITSRQPKELNGTAADGTEPEDVSEDETEMEAEGDVQPQSAVPAKARKPQVHPLPEYKHDLDLIGSGISFKEFVVQKKPMTQSGRYLLSAFWLRDHGNSPTINIHKVYTCYKTAGWPMKLQDWDNNFRQLVGADTMRRVNPGEYAITPLGEDKVREMNAAK